MITFLKRLTFSVIFTYGIAWSQSSNIFGVVADSSNGNVLIGANVIIEGTSLEWQLIMQVSIVYLMLLLVTTQ